MITELLSGLALMAAIALAMIVDALTAGPGNVRDDL